MAVCCPFPHAIPGTTQTYLEQHPSAHVNLEDGLFHCKSCGRGMNEVQFITESLGCTYGNAIRISTLCKNNEDRYLWQHDADCILQDGERQLARQFGISDTVISELELVSRGPGAIAFPVFLHDKLMDIRTYTPGAKPKVRSRSGAMAGLVLPYDLWATSPVQRTTLICAGEKDMAVARSQGFNAITLTGGESALPIYTKVFAGRSVAIVYDNDSAGRSGAIRLANYLHPHVASIKNCTAFHEVCRETGEDIADFFGKYNRTRQDLIAYLDQTPLFQPTEVNAHARYPEMDLLTAAKPGNIGKLVRSNIQVVAVAEGAFTCPATIVAEKWREPDAGKHDSMHKGDIKEWTLGEDTAEDILHLVDNNFKEEDIQKNFRKLLKISKDETYIKFRRLEKATIFKAYITDLFETTDTSAVPMEYTAYALHQRMESGKKYKATYKLVPHPYKGAQLVMLIVHLEQAEDSVSNFKVTPAVAEQLNLLAAATGSVADRMRDYVERFKSFLGYDGNNQLITAIDLAFHTPLAFNFGSFQNTRAYLDTLIVGESRMGKSSTAEAMRKLYGLGAFVSLAGNAATIPGLIGGSNKTGGGAYQTRAGIIPQNHKGLIIFEELGKSNANITAELTDIRSSNEVRITRVSGTLTLPAIVRMVTLSNVRPVDGVIKPIASYPNGIAVLGELIGTAEDIARYDLSIVLSDRGAGSIDPFWQAREPYPTECYRTRIRWIWSRSPDQIVISATVAQLIVETANRLNHVYDSHIKIFGTEAWKKLARVAIAVAGYLVSSDPAFQTIIVLPEHVSFAEQFLLALYDNETFKLKEYVAHERRYAELDEQGVQTLQDIYTACPGLLLHLEQVPSTNKNAMQAATGLENDKYNALVNRLLSGFFIKFSKYDIIPTQKLRMGMSRIDRNARIRRLGELQ